MNLSHWDQQSNEERDETIQRILHETRAGDMPPLQYRLLHWNAELTSPEIAAINGMGTHATLQPAGLASGDAAHGKMLFEKRCTGCHAEGSGREGPPLQGIFGHRAAMAAGFSYSRGLKGSEIIWSQTTLNKWLEAPDMLIPDAKMDFFVSRAQDRSDLIVYLKQWTDQTAAGHGMPQ
jgi:cytochrome c